MKHDEYYLIRPPHWFQGKALQFVAAGSRRPCGLREWARCFWNADVFYGPFPVVKIVASVSWLIAWLA